MKTIYLWRHAKSDWDDPAQSDFDRPLAARGRRDAPRMAKAMAVRGVEPALVLVSAARRAQESWELAAAQLRYGEVALRRTLYLAPPSRLLDTLARLPDGAKSVLLVGHNPGLQNLALLLAKPRGNPAARARLAAKFPTAALAVLTVKGGQWRRLAKGCARLEHLLYPKDL